MTLKIKKIFYVVLTVYNIILIVFCYTIFIPTYIHLCFSVYKLVNLILVIRKMFMVITRR